MNLSLYIRMLGESGEEYEARPEHEKRSWRNVSTVISCLATVLLFWALWKVGR